MKPSCHIPWTWLEINVVNHKIRNCCKTSWIDNNTELLFDHPTFVRRRLEFTENKQPVDCSHCWRLENQGQISYRQYTKLNPFLQTTNFDLISNVPVTLSINFGNLCNIACSYCNEEYSSKWAIEKNIPITVEKNLNFETHVFRYIDQLISNDNFQHLILIGGEPTIDPKFYQLLDLIKLRSKARKTPLKITVQTNGMYNEHHRNILYSIAEYTNVKVTYRYSIEATGKLAEFIRTGINWIQFENNFKHMVEATKTNSQLSITVHPTINLYCLEGFDNFLSWIDQFDCNTWETFGKNHVEYPRELSLSSLGIYSQQLWTGKENYKNKKLTEYSKQIKKFIESFNFTPTIEQLKYIQEGYQKNSQRSNIDIDSAIPNLNNVVTDILNENCL